jgi:multiple sugar transport system permease protein
MRRNALPYLLLAPSVVFLAVFFVMPLIQTVALSLRVDGAMSFGNFTRMAGDLNFGVAVRNTFALVLVIVPIQMALALGMAQMLVRMQRGRELVLWIWAIPLGISDLAAGLVWLALLSDTGYINSILYAFGIIQGQTSWLSYESPVSLFIAIAAAEVWRATAIVFVILLAGVQMIPKEFGEAAEVFGATGWQRFRRVTLPMLKPSIQVALILRTILAFEVFAVVYALGGRNVPVLVGEAYVWQYDNQNFGVAAAYAVLVMAISLAATVIYMRVLRVREAGRA